MDPQEEPPLPPPSFDGAALEQLALVWLLMLSPDERVKLIRTLRWVSIVFQGPVQKWPLDFGRPLSDAEEVIRVNRGSAEWIGRLAEQLDVVRRRLPPDPASKA